MEKQVMKLLTENECLFAPHLYSTHKTNSQLELRMEFIRGCEVSKVIRLLKRDW